MKDQRRRDRRNERIRRSIGLLLLFHFTLVGIIKLTGGEGEELWWLSHIALALAGVGLLADSRLLIATALTSVLGLQAIWIVDCAIGLTTGSFPLGVTTYIQHADVLDWIATAHHFYLAPLLLTLVIRARRYPDAAVALTVGLFAVLTLVSRMWLDPGENINAAYALLPGVDEWLFRQINALPGPAYLFTLNVLACGVMFFPAAMLLRRMTGQSKVET